MKPRPCSAHSGSTSASAWRSRSEYEFCTHAQRPEGYRHLDAPATYRGLDLLGTAAAERGVDTTTLALAWVLSHPQVTAVVVGPRRPEHLEPARRALELPLTADERDELARLFDP